MSTVHWLQPDDLSFPPTESALLEPNGLLAVGGDLKPERLMSAYRNGIFPWYEDPQPILWWSPSPRAVLFPDKVLVSKSLRKRIRQREYRVSCDQHFAEVIARCAGTQRRGQDGTWIGTKIKMAYQQLHMQGVAHSLEVWHGEDLIGGLYGIAIGKVFFGESMFSVRTDASKVALVCLARQLQRWSYAVIDCQVSNPHLLSMGAEVIPRQRFTALLHANIDTPSDTQWQGEWDAAALL